MEADMPSETLVESGEINWTQYHKPDDNIKSKPFSSALHKAVNELDSDFNSKH
jgi:hypothetical protein